MKITELQLRNIGVFEDENIEFPISKQKDNADIHIFTGINGSGKSTILFALASAFDYFEKKKEHTNHKSNFFYKRFRYFEEIKSKIVKPSRSRYREYKSEAIVSFDDNPPVEVFGCPDCKGVHAHTKRSSKIDIYSYYNLKNADANYEFEFAAFAYSGYRYIQSEKVDSIKNFYGNPLYQSLEFVKNRSNLSDDEPKYSINQWILNNFSNEALLLKQGKKEESDKFANSIVLFKKFISEIIEKEIEFTVEINPTKLFVKLDNEDLDFDVLPDGLRSLISWVGDLMMVMDQLKWKKDVPIFERNFVLFLDEIEVHLHPKWQRKILPAIQKLFKNAQIFLSTHSPFIVNSVDGAYVYELEYEDGNTKINKPLLSKTSDSISYTLQKVFGIENEFGPYTKEKFDQFYGFREKILKKETQHVNEFMKIKKELLELESLEVRDIVEFETNQLYKRTKIKELIE